MSDETITISMEETHSELVYSVAQQCQITT